MYEQYTDKQIVEMLEPKLAKNALKIHWVGKASNQASLWERDITRAVSLAYRSGYIRGQLGRSFIIGESKRAEHWVPATRDNVKVGDKVRYLNAEKHKQNPEFYPLQGTIGEIISVADDNTCLVQWPDYITTWFANQSDLEVLLCE